MQGQLEIVTGKGGVGKTLISSALAVRHARGKKRTLLITSESQDHSHPVFDVMVSFEPQELEEGLHIARMDAGLSLRDYIQRKTKMSYIYLSVLKKPAVMKFLDALPLFNELFTLGKIYDLVTESDFERVVFDAPSTGHCSLLLNVPVVAVQTLAGGPIHESAEKILNMLRSPDQTQLVVASLPEETPVRETLELIDYARKNDLRCERLYLNRYRKKKFDSSELRKLNTWSKNANDALPLVEAAEFDTAVAEEQLKQAQCFAGEEMSIVKLPDVAGDNAVVLSELLSHLEEQS